MEKFTVTVTENYLEIHLFWAGKGTCCIPRHGYYGPLIAALHASSGNICTKFYLYYDGLTCFISPIST